MEGGERIHLQNVNGTEDHAQNAHVTVGLQGACIECACYRFFLDIQDESVEVDVFHALDAQIDNFIEVIGDFGVHEA